ncbi:MAG TPA: 5-formyltetrahydrofolate cyclo-ligase [Deltaproteobacteria bacterium]|nr:5-formyltetrahydrofolate cyclo-ligase [Deltaproteobacteria bacterium]HQB38840.1 5-formyltetrahydrofolate cyclo-ligase [Deltaproteobacteria bacterium]
MPKQTLRQQMLKLRRAMSVDEWRVASREAQQLLMELDEYRGAACVALYAPLQNEVDTLLVRDSAFADGKRVLYPVVSGHGMVMRQAHSAEMFRQGSFGILEPVGSDDHQADEPDLIVVPGVAFDRNGHRIGFGKGYYDRFLRNPGLKACLVGFCHEFQLIDGSIAADDHDVRMDVLVTDRRVIRC